MLCKIVFLVPLLGVVTAVATTCAGDNCWNAYRHSTSIASLFCSTYLQSTSTLVLTPTATISAGTLTPAPPIVTTPIPAQSLSAQLSSRCNLNPGANPAVTSRLSSACTCLSIVPTTVTYTSVAPTTTVTIVPPTSCKDLGSPVTVDGVTFDTSCDALFGNGYHPIVSNDSPTFYACLMSCADNKMCVGVTFDPSSLFRCELVDQGSGQLTYSGNDIAIVVTA